MESSLTPAQSLTLAILCGVFFLLLDAARGLALQLGPMRLRLFSGERLEKESFFRYNWQGFSLITGALAQIVLIGAVLFTGLWMGSRSVGSPWVAAGIIWILIVSLWKALLAVIPEGFSEIALQAVIPVSHVLYILFFPVIFPIIWLSRITRQREDEEEQEEITDEAVQAYIDVGEEEGIIEESEGRMIQSIVDFGERVAREVMTPRVDVLAIEVSETVDALATMVSESKYSRIPVYEGSIDRVIGFVHIKDLFDTILREHSTSVREIMRPVYYVPETKLVSQLLREFQVEHVQIAIVLDEYGGTAGIVTIEDLIEEIVGDISDEHEDAEDGESAVGIGNGAWLVSGLFRVDRLEEMTGAELQGDDYETVAGLIFTHLGRVPKVGEQLEKAGLVFVVDRADRKRIYRVRVRHVTDSETELASAN